MSTSNPLHIYKNSNLAGEDIRFDILLSLGLIIKTFTDAAANGIALPSASELLIVYGDIAKDCFIQLAAAAVIPADGALATGMHYIPAGCMKIIDPSGAATFGIIGLTAAATGQIIIECAHSYKDTHKQQQFDRK